MSCEANQHEPAYLDGEKVTLLLDGAYPNVGMVYAHVCIVCHSLYIEDLEHELNHVPKGEIHG